MDLSGRCMNHSLDFPAILLENNLNLMSSWSISSKFILSENHPKWSAVEYPIFPLNYLSFWAYPWGRTWRTRRRSIGENLLSFLGIIEGFARIIVASMTDGINVLWGTAEPWGAVKLDDESCLISKLVGDRDRETRCSMAVEINEANLEGNKGHS